MMPTKNNLPIIFFFLLILISLLITNKTLDKLEQKYVAETQGCKFADEHFRFSCYTNLVRNYLSEHPDAQRDFYKLFLPYVINQSDLEYKKTFMTTLSTNCHTFMHAVGQVYAETALENDSQGAGNTLAILSSECRLGDRVGAIIEFAKIRNFDNDYIEKLHRSCISGITNAGEADIEQCAHALGHVYFDKYIFDTSQLHNPNNSQSITPNIESTNIEKAFSDCNKLSPIEVNACYNALAHSLFVASHYFRHSEIENKNFTYIFGKCESLKEFKERCYKAVVYRIGLNEAGPYFIVGEYDNGNEVCRVISEGLGADLGDLCYRGIGAFIGQIIHEYGKNDFESRCRHIDENYKTVCYQSVNEWTIFLKTRKIQYFLNETRHT